MGKNINLGIIIFVLIVVSMSNLVSADIISGKIHEYKFDGNASDSIGTAHGTISGAILTTGINGSSYQFDGTNDYIDLNFGSGFFADTQSFSISFWVYPLDKTQTKGIMGGLSSSNYGYGVFQYGAGDVYSVYTNRAGGGSHQTSTSSIIQNNWTNIVITYNMGTYKTMMYVNKVKELDATTLNWFENSADLMLGCAYSPVLSPYYFFGRVDNLVIYNRVLSQSDVIEGYELFLPPPCVENWTLAYQNCTIGDRRLIDYYDLNSCGTYTTLPSDNNTYVYDCDFCVEDWIADINECESNNYMIKSYTDEGLCYQNYGEYFDLPSDNGTSLICNYCSEDISFISDECLFNGTKFVSNQEYTDNNYYSCCAVTGFSSDCSINFAPYNSSGIAECEGYNKDFEIEYDDDILFGINPEDRVFWKIFINDTESTSDYDCITYVKNMKNGVIGSTIQINPAKSKREDRVISFRSKYDDRDYFHISNNIGAVYFTREDLIFDNRPYLFGVECVNDEQRLLSERVVFPNYESIHTPITIFAWAKNNVQSLIVGFFILTFISFFLAILYKKHRGLR